MNAPGSSLFDGPGEMKRLYRATDWAATPLGPLESWSTHLRTLLQLALNSGSPMSLHWGPDLTLLYNDPFIPLLGLGKHADALGRSTKEVWSESWDDVIGPLMHGVMADGSPVGFQDLPFVLERNGYPEECYFTFSYSPVFGEAGEVVGVCNISGETTRQVISERRLRLVRDLGGLSAARAGGTVTTCRAMLDVLAGTRQTVPFAAMLLLNESDDAVEFVGSFGVRSESWASGRRLADTAPVAADIDAVMTTGKSQLLTGLRQRLGELLTPGPIGPLLPDEGMVLPLVGAPGTRPIGVIVLGINPYRPVDEEYRSFLNLVGQQVGSALSDVKAYESERRQVRLLADLDLVKMQFFQNVSHELRTPLTLLLAPLQDLLAPGQGLRPEQTERVDAALRAARRLRRIVDALLDFAQAEARTLAPRRQFIDIAKATADTASMFRSTAEHAGLSFTVSVPVEPAVALVDGAMWATIVTNLVANAVKFTQVGGVTVGLDADEDSVVLTVADTGVGVSTEEQPKIFDRFYRSQSNGVVEGAGIGLALVTDLVDAHHGHIALTSVPGTGSTFTVTVPRAEGEAAAEAEAANEERESTNEATPVVDTGRTTAAANRPTAGTVGERPTLVLVEDDTDLRVFLTQLLTNDGWLVRPVGDAESAAALVLAGDPATVDLVLTDVMLPGIDGLELLSRLRAAPGAVARLPIILLTARGGAGAAAQGLAAGADDYVVKPFESTELLARVRTAHELHRLREREITTANSRAGQLRSALDSNRAIGTATGILMATYRLTAADGFALLTRASQDSNRKLRDVASTVVSDGRLPFRPTEVDHMLQRLKR